MSKSVLESKIQGKREKQILKVINTVDKSDENYDYAHFKAEYNEDIKIAERSNNTLNHTEAKEEESVKEAMQKMVDFKETPRNCTKEETKGIGEKLELNFSTQKQKLNINFRFSCCEMFMG